MRLNHIHFAVRGLPVAIGWLEQVWDARPTFRNERMAEVPSPSFWTPLTKNQSLQSALRARTATAITGV